MVTRATFLTAATAVSAASLIVPTFARAQSSSPAGVWYNELNSKLTLAVGTDGQLTGTYVSAVGRAKGSYPVVGRYDTQPGTTNISALGFVVVWHNAEGNSHSVTSWSGQYQPHGAQGEQIFTTWLLTVQSAIADNWGSTRVGRDVFLRRMRTQSEINAHLGLGNFSEPGTKR
jgi:hypothetical protein